MPQTAVNAKVQLWTGVHNTSSFADDTQFAMAAKTEANLKNGIQKRMVTIKRSTRENKLLVIRRKQSSWYMPEVQITIHGLKKLS